MSKPITIEQITHCGIDPTKAQQLLNLINSALNELIPEHAWQTISKKILTPDLPFALHLLLFSHIYPKWPKQLESAPAWFPTNDYISNIKKAMLEKKFIDYQALYNWSIHSYLDFLQWLLDTLNIIFKKNPEKLFDASQWLIGAKLNITDSLFSGDLTKTAIIYREHQQIKKLSYAELDQLSNQIANSLVQLKIKPGAPIAIVMPMTHLAVAIYLAIIKMGGVVISIADSFSTDEIATRLDITKTKLVFTQDRFLRSNKSIDLYNKVKLTHAQTIIVIPHEKNNPTPLRSNDLAWESFLVLNTQFSSYAADPMSHCNILFSSGTTGTPKAIPWTQVTTIKAASDGYLHQDIKTNDIVAWPTNLGWMMGPWLIFAGLVNHATIALYDDVPTGRGFGEFVQDAGVTILGLVPAIVAHWNHTQCMKGLNWEKIKLFSSSGECSNPIDMLYLMSLAGYKPIIEYCGGTEIGGAYITSTLVQNNYPSLFTTPALGSNFILIDEQGHVTDDGEVALIPPAIGLSNEIINGNHHDIYFANMPKSNNGIALRRHGDHFKKLTHHLYLALGRTDDTMNLGGIKVGSAEIERVLAELDFLRETAAIAISPTIPGPSCLVIFAVTKKTLEKSFLLKTMQQQISQHLNPLFKIHDIIITDALPKTASNKIIRKRLRNQYINQ